MKQSDFEDFVSVFHQSINSKRLTPKTASKRAV